MGIFKKFYLTLREQGRYPLNQRSSLRAAWDFSVAQVAARLIPGEVCVEFPNDTKLIVPPHMKGASHFIFPGLCEFGDMGFVLHFLRPEDLFTDVGANIGAYTVLAGGAIGCRVVSFEPSAKTFKSLLTNIQVNGFSSRATAYNKAVGREPGTLNFSEGLGTENFVQTGGNGATGNTVEVTSLDHALGQSDPVLMKIDVEGFETEVIAGAASVLKKESLQALIIEKNESGSRYGFDESKLHQTIMSFGFKPFCYSPKTRTIQELPPGMHGNVVYLKNFERARDRVRNAPKFQYKGFSI